MDWKQRIKQSVIECKQFIPFFYATTVLFTFIVEDYNETWKLDFYGILTLVSLTVIFKAISTIVFALVIWKILQWFEINESPRAPFFKTTSNLYFIQLYCVVMTEIINFPSIEWRQCFLLTIFLTLLLLSFLLFFGYFKFLYFEWRKKKSRGGRRRLPMTYNTTYRNIVENREGLSRQPPPIINSLTTNDVDSATPNLLSENPTDGVPASHTTDLHQQSNDTTRIMSSAELGSSSRPILEPTMTDFTPASFTNSVFSVPAQEENSVNQNSDDNAPPPTTEEPLRERESEANPLPGPSGDNQEKLFANSGNQPLNPPAALTDANEAQDWQLIQNTTRSGKVYFSAMWNSSLKITRPVERNISNKRCRR